MIVGISRDEGAARCQLTKLKQSMSRFQCCVYFVEITIGKRRLIYKELSVALVEAITSEFSSKSLCEIYTAPELFGALNTAGPAEYLDQFLLKTNGPVLRDER